MSLLSKILNRSKSGGNFVSAVIAAAGSSNRMGNQNKLLCDLLGIPVLVHTLLAFETCPSIGEIVIVSREEDIVDISNLCAEYKIRKAKKVVKGGDTRSESVLAGLMEVQKDANLVAIHDGARPLITPELIEKTVRCASEFSAAAPAVMLKDTIKEVSGNVILRTIPRSTLRAVQTPQVFDLELIKGALTDVLRRNVPVTDDCEAVELIQIPVRLIEGSYENIKITTPEDLETAEAFLLARNG